MQKAFPKAFKEDVLRVARNRGPDTSLEMIAKDFGISSSCLQRWIKQEAVDEGREVGVSTDQAAENRELRRRNCLLEQENEVLRRAAAYLAGQPETRWLPKMIYPLVRELAAPSAPVRVPVAVTCRVLNIAKQPYYRWLKAPISDRDWDDAHLANAAFDVHADDPAFGYRFIADELADAGFTASERRVWRVCSERAITSVIQRKRRGKTGKVGPPVRDDLVQRTFSADEPDRLWLTDITEHPTREGKLYLCAVKDVFSNRIVGYSIDARMTSDLAVDALRMAVQRRRPSAPVTVHSDRGSQFRSRKNQHELDRHGLIGSMGRVGAAGDNAAMESFFALLQKNVLNLRAWDSREQLRIAIVTWIERTYHRRRRQRVLGRLTPIEYEAIMAPQVALAA
ncbi:IS3 family transposase [Demequina sp.]|uniref:IS3 family transposase n=1 Tax=Demequina sp. TaxID=2050685 RepID=UPI003A892B4C